MAFLSIGNEVIQSTRKLIFGLRHTDNFTVDLQADSFPVTEVDLNVEELVRERNYALMSTNMG